MANRIMALQDYLELEGKNDARRRTTITTACTTGIMFSCARTDVDPEDEKLTDEMITDDRVSLSRESTKNPHSRKSTIIIKDTMKEEEKVKHEASRQEAPSAAPHPEHAENFFQLQHKLNIEIESKRIQQEMDAKISAKNELKELNSLQAMCLEQLKGRFVKCSQEMQSIMENIKTVESSEELKALDEAATLHESCGKACFDIIVRESAFLNTLKEQVDAHTQEIKALKEELKELKEEVC